MVDATRLYIGTQEGLTVSSEREDRCATIAQAFDGALIHAIAGCRQQPQRLW